MRIRRLLPLALVLLLPACASPVPAPDGQAGPPPVATFSIVAFDAETGDLGVAVQSRFLGVGSVVPWAKAGVGAVATQAWANTTFGPDGLELLGRGATAKEVVEILTRGDPGRDYRQLGVVDAEGRAASFTGEKALAWAGHVVGDGYACQGNILAGEGVVRAMAGAFEASTASLPERLVDALQAGQAEGGDSRGMQSAALLVVRRQGGYSGFNDRMIDLRVEDHEKPIEELGRLLALHRKTFGRAPRPDAFGGFSAEPAPEPGSLATPRGTWEAFVAAVRARDAARIHALQTKSFRAENPVEEFAAGLESAWPGYESFVDRFRYSGTRIDGETARVALSAPGSPRPTLVSLVLEEGEWRLPD